MSASSAFKSGQLVQLLPEWELVPADVKKG